MSRLRTSLAEAPQPSTDWRPPAGAIEDVWIWLSPFAPGCDDLPIDDLDRSRWVRWATPRQILRLTLARLQRRSDQVALRHTVGLDGVEVHDGPDEPSPGCAALLAIVYDVPPDQLVLAHRAARAAIAEANALADGGKVVAFPRAG